jgi:hypothetical protein
VTELEQWWDHLRTTALVGTARREVPPIPDLGPAVRVAATREETLLDAAALGDAVRRAGRLADRAPDPDVPAPDEGAAPAPAPAAQLLELLLTQGPVAAGARVTLIVHWLECAAAAGRIVPPRLLPTLLDSATPMSALRPKVRPVLGERGAWLAARNPAWSWVVDGLESPAGDRVGGIIAVRRADPDAGRELVESALGAGAQERALAVAALSVGLGPGDEDFLEHCLDDRARAVREEAQRLLDRLPGSARAARMTERLRPLLHVTGTVRKQLDVLLPDDPDAAAVRDGLVDPGPRGSRRARWRDQLILGAPLDVWTDVARGGPDKALGMLRDHDGAIARALAGAAAGRGDLDWGRALLARIHDSRLVALLPKVERDDYLVARLSRESLVKIAGELQQAPRPWGPRLSKAVLIAIGREQDAGHAVRILRDTLPTALHPSTLPAVEKAMKAAGDDAFLRTTLRDVLQFQSLHTSISEAFR